MTRIVNRVGDAMLRKLLGSETAGACVPENGTYCGCIKASDGYCSGGRWVYYKRKGYYNCYGSCVTSTSRPVCGSVVTQLACP